MGQTAMEYMRGNLEKYKRLAPKFKSIFGMDLMPYWNHITGFDIVKFDDLWIGYDGYTGSLQDFVKKKWGKPGVNLILELIGKEKP